MALSQLTILNSQAVPFRGNFNAAKSNFKSEVNDSISVFSRRLSRVSCTLTDDSQGNFPSFIPPLVNDLSDVAKDMARKMQRLPVETSLTGSPILTGCLVPENAGKNDVPVLLIHSFDSSCLEWRKLYPRLKTLNVEAWAVDVLGWGFTDSSDVSTLCSAEAKRTHIIEFWKQYIQRPVVVVGTSLGGAAAIDLALNHPEAVSKVILIDAQAFSEGLGPMASLPKFLSYAGVAVLQSLPLRRAANGMAYHDPKLATEDAVLTGRIHTHLPAWSDCMVSFMQSGGYNLADKVKNVQQETLIIWGAEDRILEFEFAKRFMAELPNAQLEVLPECGHVPHLEKPSEVAELIAKFAC